MTQVVGGAPIRVPHLIPRSIDAGSEGRIFFTSAIGMQPLLQQSMMRADAAVLGVVRDA